MKSIVIHVHSFVDLITNSSSETFVNASDGSLKTIKSLVDRLLSVAGSNQKCDDLFTLDIVYKYQTEDYDDLWLTIKEAKEKFEDGTLSKEENEEDGYKYDGCYGESSIRVTPKDASNKDHAAIATTLSTLQGLFSYDSTYNG